MCLIPGAVAVKSNMFLFFAKVVVTIHSWRGTVFVLKEPFWPYILTGSVIISRGYLQWFFLFSGTGFLWSQNILQFCKKWDFSVIIFFKDIELVSPHQMRTSINWKALSYQKIAVTVMRSFKLTTFLKTAFTARRFQSY